MQKKTFGFLFLLIPGICVTTQFFLGVGAANADPLGSSPAVSSTAGKAPAAPDVTEGVVSLRVLEYTKKTDKGRPIFGARKGRNTIIEFGDIQCSFCGQSHVTIKDIMSEYPKSVRYIYRHNPLDFHPLAMPAARYYEAIAKQSGKKAWLFLDKVLSDQRKFNQVGIPFLRAVADELNVDVARMDRELSGNSIDKNINIDIEDARSLNATGTPFFIVNGTPLRGAYPKSEFLKLLKSPR